MTYRLMMVVVATLAFAACGSSPPTRYYTLDAIEPVAVSTYASVQTPIMITKVVLPATLDRPQIVRRISANRLDIDELDRWAAPLEDIVQYVLTQDLAARMAPGKVIQPGASLPTGALQRIIINVMTFEADLDGGVILRAQWTIKREDPAAARVSNNEYIAINAGSGDTDALAAGMSRALAELADRMVTAFR
jgi:uncharacterized protein